MKYGTIMHRIHYTPSFGDNRLSMLPKCCLVVAVVAPSLLSLIYNQKRVSSNIQHCACCNTKGMEVDSTQLIFALTSIYRYTKANSLACNTSKINHDTSSDTVGKMAREDHKINAINLSKDLYSSGKHIVQHETPTSATSKKDKNIAEDFRDLMESRMTDDCVTSTPRHTPFKNNKSNSAKNSSNWSAGTNRSGNNSRHSYSMRSQKSLNDTFSFDSSMHVDSPIVSQRFALNDRSKDRRHHISPISLSEFVTAATPIKGKKNRSINTSQENQGSNVDRSSDKDFPALTPKGKTGRTTPSEKKKPVKRVVPTLISGNQNNFTSPVFRTDNNILGLKDEDTDISRDILRTQKDVIRQGFMEENQPEHKNALQIYKKKCEIKSVEKKLIDVIDLTRVTHQTVLDRLIEIYTIILDLNLTINVLNEIAFLVNLINIDCEMFDGIDNALDINSDEKHGAHIVNDRLIDDVFKSMNNCVYFGLGVLKCQNHFLTLLDSTTLKVLLDNDRIIKFGPDIKQELHSTYNHKAQLEVASHSVSQKPGHSFQVFYQQEQDTKINFSSAQEFTSFKKQRDSFYTILG